MIDLPVYIVDIDETEGMVVNSFVDEPAHRQYFIAQNAKELQFNVNDEKKIVTGVVIAANKPIYYYSQDVPECYIVFTKETIRKIAENYFMQDKFNLIDVQHDFNIRKNSAIMLESYFTDEDKKSQFDVDEGSWIASYKIIDEELWQQIKEGKLKGFSIAGNFNMKNLKFVKNNKNQSIMEKLLEKLEQAIAKVEAMFNNNTLQFINAKTVDGKSVKIVEKLEAGQKLYIIADDGTEVLAPQGDYVVEIDGKLYVISVAADDGVITAITEKAQEQEQEQLQQRDMRIAQLENEIKILQGLLQEAKKELEKKNPSRNPEPIKTKNLFDFKI